MESIIKSFGLVGIEPYLVTVESDITKGIPSFDMVGLPDAAVKEARDRIRSAAKNSGIEFPLGKIIVNLAPADTKKVGSIYDLPMLISILRCSGFLNAPLDNIAFVGEVSLGGEIRPVKGVLPMIIDVKKLGVDTVVIPYQNASEGAMIQSEADGVTIYVASTVNEVIAHIKGRSVLPLAKEIPINTIEPPAFLDLSDVKGQNEAKRALEVAASGGHNLLMIGPPGSGKSMLAQRIPNILQPLSYTEQVSTTKIYSVAGELKAGTGLISVRPFRAPHHNISNVGLIGGGVPIKPGEISLAHNGVLFLDEMAEFPQKIIESLRQPLETHNITISRASGKVAFPSNFMMVGAMNPCPCGYFGHPTRKCVCSSSAISRYLAKISGPLLDRMDIHIEVSPLEYSELTTQNIGESSKDVFERIARAREIQAKRYTGTEITLNAEITPAMLQSVCVLTAPAEKLIKVAFDRMALSARGYNRILKVSRTIADLDASKKIDIPHVSEAIQYRSLERKYWQR